MIILDFSVDNLHISIDFHLDTYL